MLRAATRSARAARARRTDREPIRPAAAHRVRGCASFVCRSAGGRSPESAPGHEGTMCWYVAAGHRVSDYRSRVSDYRREMLPEQIETLGTARSGLYALFVPYGRGGSWEGGLP